MNEHFKFSVRHAFLMLGGVVLSLFSGSCLPLTLTALASFAFWLFELRARFRSEGFGAANVVTSMRLVTLSMLAALFDARLPLWASLLALTIFCLDWLDGHLARRTHSESSFGALFDSEVDASFTMLLTLGVFQLGHAGAWVLIGGLLRYGYVLCLHFTRVPEAEAPRSRFGRYVFGVSVSGYMLSLWPFAPAGMVLSGLATALLCYSFSRSFRWTFAPQRRTTG